MHHRFTEGQQAGAHGLLAALLAGCVFSVLTLPAVCSSAEWQSTSDLAVQNTAGLEVVAALLEAHPEAAQVADTV